LAAWLRGVTALSEMTFRSSLSKFVRPDVTMMVHVVNEKASVQKNLELHMVLNAE
jgi:hypothetical protein